jgi:hypothetical protein
MRRIYRQATVFGVLLCIVLCLISCEKKKIEGKVSVSAQEFVLRKDNAHSYVIDARGKIKNTGEVDVKNIVVTGYCRSCGEEWIPKRWFVGAEKLPEQKDTIQYLPAGKEADFYFRGIADILLDVGAPAPSLPDKLEVVVESFETVEK